MSARKYRYRQLNVICSLLLFFVVAWTIVTTLVTDSPSRLAIQAAILTVGVALSGWGIMRRDRRPSRLVPALTGGAFALATIGSFTAGNSIDGVSGIVITIVTPLFLMDKRIDRLFRYPVLGES